MQVASETWECLGSLGTLVCSGWIEERGRHRQPRRGGQSGARSEGQGSAPEARGEDFRTAAARQGQERRPGELGEHCARRAECAGGGGWAAVCAGGAEGSVAGQWLMGERANEKLRNVSRKEQGDWLKWGRAQRGVCLHLGGVCEDVRQVGWQESRGFPACACWLCRWRRRQIFPRGRTRPDPGIRGCDPVLDLSRSWACRAGWSSGAIRMVGSSVVYILGTGRAHGGSRGLPVPPRRPQRLP